MFRLKARRTGLILTVAVAALAGVFWMARRPSPHPRWVSRITGATRATRPNILFVVYDARRRDDFSFGTFGNKRGDTPFLAGFKDEAAYFEEAVSPGCWTVPVHASMFSGLSVCDLGNDYYNPGFATFPDHFLSLAEILGQAGYRTIAWPDHPFFYNRNLRLSLVRGFEQFDIVNDFIRYASYTNVGTARGAVERQETLRGMPDLEWEELAAEIGRFNRGETVLDEAGADRDLEHGVLLPKLYEMFRESAYFRKRYADPFDRHVFAGDTGRPYFLFLNLHMCTIAEPDPGLFSRWFLKALMLNAKRKGTKLTLEAGEGVRGCLTRNYARLGLDLGRPIKHVFDNRFYDACFRAVWEYLEGRGLTRNTATIVTSDHGMGFGEQGEGLYAHNGTRPYEFMTRVPIVLRFPAGSPLARLHGRYGEKVSLTDLFDTLVEIGLGAGVFERSEPVRGRSLIQRLRNRDFEPILVAESSLRPEPYKVLPGTIGYAKAAYSGSQKLIYAPGLRRAAASPWPDTVRLKDAWPLGSPSPALEKLSQPLLLFYDLATDPHEQNDVAASQGAAVEALRRILHARWSCEPARPDSPIAAWDRDARETLRSLGYLN